MLQGCTHVLYTVMLNCIDSGYFSWDLCSVSSKEGRVLIFFLKILIVKSIFGLFEQWNVFVYWKFSLTTIVTVAIFYVRKKRILWNCLRWIPKGGIILSFGVCRMMNRSAPLCSTVTILSGPGPEFVTRACNGSVAACTLLFKLFYYLSPEIWDKFRHFCLCHTEFK